MDSQELQKIKTRYDIVGNNPALNNALETAVAVAPTDLTVLITGKSGVGKEVLPQIIHNHSRRRNGRYLAVNCGAIPPGTINSELFGHEKGSFTGAVAERKGYFEEADGGTLFLDEIGELPKDTQAMLLRVLQSGEFIKVGSSKTEKTDVRVVAATNVDLLHAVANGKFREDLYYRLNAINISVPTLSERKDDVYLLFRKFSSDFSQKYNLCRISLSIEAIALLRAYRWPGNIRQLKNFAESVTALAARPSAPGSDKMELGAEAIKRFLPDEQDTLLPATCPTTTASGVSEDDRRVIIKALLDLKREVDYLKEEVSHLRSLGETVKRGTAAGVGQVEEPEWQDTEHEKELSIRKASDDLIEKALEKHGGKVKDAARELGISERTLYRKLSKTKQ